jgi:hypothetical protein
VLIREGLRDIPQMKGMLDGLKDAELVVLANIFQPRRPVRVATLTASPTSGKDTAQNAAPAAICRPCGPPATSMAGWAARGLVYSMTQFRDHAGLGVTPSWRRPCMAWR